MGSLGLTGILTIIFVIAKIMGKIAWSWLWVFSPIWLSFALVLAFLGVLSISIGLAALSGKK